MRIVVLILCLAGLTVLGCAKTPPAGEPSPYSIFGKNPLQKADEFFAQKKYIEAIAAYRWVIAHSPADDAAAEAKFKVGFTLAFFDNPQRNYTSALSELDEFLRLHPGNNRTKEAQNLRHLIKLILESKKEKEILNKNIEELKKLDVKHEERRRGK